jgi:hypothetical protein
MLPPSSGRRLNKTGTIRSRRKFELSPICTVLQHKGPYSPQAGLPPASAGFFFGLLFGPEN